MESPKGGRQVLPELSRGSVQQRSIRRAHSGRGQGFLPDGTADRPLFVARRIDRSSLCILHTVLAHRLQEKSAPGQLKTTEVRRTSYSPSFSYRSWPRPMLVSSKK
jgi:hypothetical protein